MKDLKIGIVGATGVVGETFVYLLQEFNIPVAELRPFASESSLGKKITCFDEKYPCQVLKPGCFEGLDVVFFSSGDPISKEWAPQAVKEGAFAIDNSAAFRMDDNTLLCVPEVNGDQLPKAGDAPAIIANPNCSTIQLVVALKPLAEKYGLKSVRVASYQSVSGAGRDGLDDLLEQSMQVLNGKEVTAGKTFDQQIAFNAIPQIGGLRDDGFCSEEFKIMNESKKILSLPDLPISAFTVRIPSINGHSEAVWFELNQSVATEDIANLLQSSNGIEVVSEKDPQKYPMNVTASGQNPVYIGKLRQDPAFDNSFQMWVVADNLRKGAALNGLQIAQAIFDRL